MERDDIIDLLCKLKYGCDDFPTMSKILLYEFRDREYRIELERDAGRFVKFYITDIGMSKEEKTKIENRVKESINENN